MFCKEITVLKEKGRESLESTRKCRKSRKRIESEKIVQVTKLDHRKSSLKFGKKYPGIVIGHQSCEGSSGLVPKYMGWLWDIQYLGANKVRKGAVSKPIEEILKSFLNPDFVGEMEAQRRNVESKETLDVIQDKSTERNAKQFKSDTKSSNFSKVTNSKNAQTQYNIKDCNEDIRRDSKSKKTNLDLKNSTLKLKDNDKKSPGKIKNSPENASSKRAEDKVPVTKQLKEVKRKDKNTSKNIAVKDENPTQKKLTVALKDNSKKKDPLTNGMRKEMPNSNSQKILTKKMTEQKNSKIPSNNQKKVQDSHKLESKIADKNLKNLQSSFKSEQNKTSEKNEKTSSKLPNKPLQKSQNNSTTPE